MFCVYALLMLVISIRRFSLAEYNNGASKLPESSIASTENTRISTQRMLLWLLLAGFASALLVATTNRIGQDVPAVPFLFILPLCLYLVTFIIAFDGPKWYVRRFFYTVLPIGICCALYEIYMNIDLAISTRIVLYSIALFTCCMCCHGELARHKLATQHLTLFYLLIALGGAIGSAFSALLAPQIFFEFTEYQISLLGCFALVMFLASRERFNRSTSKKHPAVGKYKYYFAGKGLAAYSIISVLALSILMFIKCKRMKMATLNKLVTSMGHSKFTKAMLINLRFTNIQCLAVMFSTAISTCTRKGEASELAIMDPRVASV